MDTLERLLLTGRLDQVLLITVLALCVVCIIKMVIIKTRKKDEPYDKEFIIPRRLYMVLFAVVAFIAVAVRVWKFGEVPGGFNQDGAMAAVDAKALAVYGTDRYGMRLPVHLTAWGYGQMSALLSYLMVPFIKIAGFTPFALRLPQLITSLAGLLCLYLLVREVFGNNIALAVFAFAAVNPWHILQSRWALDCNLYPHFFIFGIYFLNKGIVKRKLLYVSMVFFGLCMYCYGISIYTMPLFLLMACVYFLLSKRMHIKDIILPALVYFLVGGPFILVMIINFFKWDTIETPLFTMPYFPDSVRSNDILFFSDNIVKQFIENFQSLMDVTLLQYKDLPWNDVEGFGTMYLFTMPFVILGIIVLFRRYRKNPGAMLVVFFFLTGIACGLLTKDVNVNRINIIYYPIIIFAGIGIYETVRVLVTARFVVPVVYILVFSLFVNTYFTTYAVQIRQYFHGDFSDALEAVKDADVDKYYITSYNGSNDLTEILVLFHHCIDAEYFQGKTTEDGMSFAEKYTISPMENVVTSQWENAAYVVSSQELGYFDTSFYKVSQFGNYYVLEPGI